MQQLRIDLVNGPCKAALLPMGLGAEPRMAGEWSVGDPMAESVLQRHLAKRPTQLIFGPLLLFILSPKISAADCPARGSVAELFGTIGQNIGLTMNLTFQKDSLRGSYAYVKYEKKILLTGTCTGGLLTLQESNAAGRPAGFFRGSFRSAEVVEGSWSTPDGKKNLPFHLQILLRTDHVSGRYKTGNYLDGKSSRGAELNVLLLKDGSLRIQGDAVWISPANPNSVHDGQVDGTGKLEGDTAYYVESSREPDSCRFTVRFMDRMIAVSDDNGRCGGMNVTFNGAYQRLGPPTFDEKLK